MRYAIYALIASVSAFVGMIAYNRIIPAHALSYPLIGALSAFLVALSFIPFTLYLYSERWIRGVTSFLVFNIAHLLFLPLFFMGIMNLGFDWSFEDKHTSFIVLVPVLIMGILSFFFHVFSFIFISDRIQVRDKQRR